MKIDLAKQVIASVFLSRKGKDVKRQDFVRELAYKQNILKEEQVNLFLDICVNSGILAESEEKLAANFSLAGVEIPLVFEFKAEELLVSDGTSLMDRMLEAAGQSGKISVDEATEAARRLQDSMKYITFEIALLCIMRDMGIDITTFLEELS